jgi:hypothetical protein
MDILDTNQKKKIDLSDKKSLNRNVKDVNVSTVCDASVNTKDMKPDPDEQLLADLEAGHVRGERPVSLVSSCSGDTGIVADYRSDTKDRPMSMISTTSSVDTGQYLGRRKNQNKLVSGEFVESCNANDGNQLDI